MKKRFSGEGFKIAYFDCFSGISGDMCLGALVDTGVSIKRLENELKKIPIKGYRLRVKKVRRAGFRATKVDVIPLSAISHQLSAKKWTDIRKIIKASSLSDEIKQRGLNIFKRLFEAEAKVHGEKFDKVHLHELGAVDCIVDIFGAIIGLDILGIERVYASSVNVGGGLVKTSHGILPVPAPATAEILRNQKSEVRNQIYSDETQFELTTPTGAAIISEISSDFGSMPPMTIEKIGIGAGAKDFKDKANVLRMFIGQTTDYRQQTIDNTITIIETNIDDMNPQIYEYVIEKLFKAGALDVYLTQVIMKKGRPGVKLTVLCNDKEREALTNIILKETTTIGLRFYEAQRKTLKRDIKRIDTEFGKVKFKVSKSGNKTIRITPEYEDCKRLAKKFDMPLIEVMKKGEWGDIDRC